MKTILNRKWSYSISLFILIPLIFSGISIISFIIALRLSDYTAKAVTSDMQSLLWGLLIWLITFLCGLLITWLIVNPMRKFVSEAEKLPILPEISEIKSHETKDEIERFNIVFREVTKFLGKVEAKELFPDIIGQSRVMRGLFNEIIKIAPTDATVLITGESGTGKELIATGIYNHSIRKGRPFIKLSCVAIPEGLLESELFGHEKGAFTGATAKKIGKFELANDGSLLLDEIGDMPLETQAKLLRVLQEKEFERVGGNESIKVNVRFIAASNKDLETMVTEGKFREDLYYRLNVINLHIPPLRERREDIPLLIEYYLDESSSNGVQVSPAAMQYMMMYSWPGNVRELKNTVERAALMADSGVIEPVNIPPGILSSLVAEGHQVNLHKGGGNNSTSTTDTAVASSSMDERLASIERSMIIDALMSSGCVQARAAELLGIKERSLWHRIKKYEIDVASLKSSINEEM